MSIMATLLDVDNMQKILQDVHIGVNLRRLRDLNNYTQTDVVNKLQLRGRTMSDTTYGHIEQGRRNIYVSDLLLLAEVFNVDVNELFVGLKPLITEKDQQN